MIDESIRSTEFTRAIASINSSIDAVRSDVASLRDDLGSRIDRLESRHDESMDQRILDAKEEGRLLGRVEAVENRMDSHDKWRLAIAAPGLMALGTIITNWIKNWVR